MRHAWIVGCLLLLAACSNKATDSAVALTVKYPGYTPLCLRVTASDAAAPERRSEELITQSKLASDEDRTLIFAVYREKSWSQQLQVEVASYATADCTGDAIETRQLAAAVTLPDKGAVPAALELLARDTDKDGHVARATGDSAIKGSDCDDSRGDVHPGATAVCDGTLNLNTDFDCDEKLDCNGGHCSDGEKCGSGFCVAGICCDSACNEQSQCRSAGVCGTGTCTYTVNTGASCNDGSACTDGDKCDSSGGCAGTPRVCNSSPGQCYAAAGTCNTATGACVYPPKPATDSCNDGMPCTDGDKCNGAGACAGTPKVCNSPQGQCYVTAGTCNTTTGACVYNPKPATDPCDDGQLCTDGDKCNGSGTCVGTPKVCNGPAPTPCYVVPGTCETSSGLCKYNPKPSTDSCDDGKDCTSPDTCNGAGNCVSTFNCPPPSICKEAVQACTMDGKCQFQAAPGQVGKACSENGTAGTCQADGTCQPLQFSYTVTPNFNPAAIATSPNPINDLDVCGATFDSGTTSWTFATGCNFTPPTHVVTNDGFVVLPVRNLTVSAPLRLVGSRPVILAVYGDATLNADILAHSAHLEAVVGAGSGAGCSGRTGSAGDHDGSDGRGGGGGGLASMGGAGGISGGDPNGRSGPAGGGPLSGGFSLVGGCAGGIGGSPTGTTPGAGGPGGGGVQISVAGTLTVKGVVTVSGAGGKGGRTNTNNKSAAGGGGGSGGLLVLEANSLVFEATARVTANGGAGGEGAGSQGSSYFSGNPGQDGAQDTATAASGGNGGANDGGAGGAGAAGNSNPGGGTRGTSGQNGSGGGGGGAAGRLLLRGASGCPTLPAGAIVSPVTATTCS